MVQSQQRNLSENQIAQRLKQIDLGYRTLGYQRYIKCIHTQDRNRQWRNTWHPTTPDPRDGNYSQRAFQGCIRSWRKSLHRWTNMDDETYEYLCKHYTEHRQSVPLHGNENSINCYHNVHLPQFPKFPIHDNIKRFTQNRSLNRTQLDRQYSTTWIEYKKGREMDQCRSDIVYEYYPMYPATYKGRNDKHGDTKSGPRINVPPVYQLSELLVLTKPSEIIEAAEKASQISKLLVERIVKGFYTKRNNKSMNHTKINLLPKIQLPIAFIPKWFRGMQIWPECFFIKEDDLEETIRSPITQHDLLTIECYLGHIPKILGMPVVSYLDTSDKPSIQRPSLSCNKIPDIQYKGPSLVSTTIADKTEIMNLLKHRSLSHHALMLERLPSMKVPENDDGTDTEKSLSPTMLRTDRYSGFDKERQNVYRRSTLKRF